MLPQGTQKSVARVITGSSVILSNALLAADACRLQIVAVSSTNSVDNKVMNKTIKLNAEY